MLEIQFCKNCAKSIPTTRNKGALFCTNECGYTYRNDAKAAEKKKQKEKEPGLYKSYNIVKNIILMGLNDISIETAKDLGFNFDNQGLTNIDKEKNTTEYRLFEFSYTIYNDRIKIKKITDERPPLPQNVR